MLAFMQAHASAVNIGPSYHKVKFMVLKWQKSKIFCFIILTSKNICINIIAFIYIL